MGPISLTLAEAVVVGKSSQVCLASSAGESPGTGSCRRLAGPGVGERLREWREPGLPGLLDRIRGALGSTYLEPGVRELPLVRPASELGRVCLAGMAARYTRKVQQQGADVGKSQPHRSRDACRRARSRCRGRTVLTVTVAAFAGGRAALTLRSTPSDRYVSAIVAHPLTVRATRGPGAAPMAPVRRWACWVRCAARA